MLLNSIACSTSMDKLFFENKCIFVQLGFIQGITMNALFNLEITLKIGNFKHQENKTHDK